MAASGRTVQTQSLGYYDSIKRWFAKHGRYLQAISLMKSGHDPFVIDPQTGKSLFLHAMVNRQQAVINSIFDESSYLSYGTPGFYGAFVAVFEVIRNGDVELLRRLCKKFLPADLEILLI